MSVPDRDQMDDELSLEIDENQDVEMLHSDAPLSVNTAEVPDILETDDEGNDTVMRDINEPYRQHTQQEVLAYAEVLASMNQRVDIKVAEDVDDDPNDIYKPEGIIQLEIDCFSEFCRGIPDAQQRLSKPVYVRGLPWKILAIPRDNQPRAMGRSHRALGFFLQCNGDCDGVAWNCVASATLKVKSQRENIEDHSRRISHTFYPKENDWGYSQFLTCDHLANPDNGFIKNDTVKLMVHVCADAPHGVSWDSKKHAGHIGLKNQGATCYMNSILQTLFFTNKLRKAVYEMPTTNDEADNNVALAMQRVFYDLQHSDRPVGTKKLTKSFGWDSLETFMQHDVQELCRVLLDNLENKMKGTPIESTIPNLFKGKMKSYIKCVNVDYESGREEFFYDIQLNIKGKNDIIESFREYTQAERLDGENKYDAGIHGLQTAEKGVKFITFPPVLHLQLMRFQYDGHLDSMVKINDRFEFPDVLNLNEFTVKGEDNKDDYTYRLHAVLVHSGDFHGGHYVVFINTSLVGTDGRKSRWCKFDDDVVSRSSARDAILANYGGDDSEAPTRTFTNAYMLVYVKESLINDVLAPITDEDIPKHLRVRFEKERAEESKRKKEKMEAHLYTEIIFITECAMLRHHGFDLVDIKLIDEELPKERVEKALTLNDLYDKAVRLLCDKNQNTGDVNGINVNKIRLWKFNEDCFKEDSMALGTLSRIRPSSLIPFREGEDERTIDKQLEPDRTLIFIEGPNEFLPEYDEAQDMLMFLKFYNAKNQTLSILGHMNMNYKKPLGQYLVACRRMAGLCDNAEVRFYEEIAPDRIRLVENYGTQMCHDNVIMEVNDGGILIFEAVEDTTPDNNAKTFLERIYNTIDVEIIMNTDTFLSIKSGPEDPIIGQIGLDWSCSKLTEFIGNQIGYNPGMILLWRMQAYHDRPNNYINYDACSSMRVKDLLNLVGPNAHDPRRGKRYRLFYTKMPIKIVEMDRRKQMKIQIMDEKMNVQEISIFPEKNGCVAHILEEAKREFPFSPDGTGKLRLVYVGQNLHSMRVYQVFSENVSVMEICQKQYTPAYMFRVEEVPEDQMVMQPGDYLLPVAHFDRDPGRMFGVPFFLKVRHEEPFSSVKERLQKKLDVSDKDFEKYKFALISNNRIVRYLEMDNPLSCVNLSELGHAHMTTTNSHPFLGLDHMNKSRGSRATHGAEKAIVIHN